jgi:LmbE family N-acetylglucosaminyl deacetylase
MNQHLIPVLLPHLYWQGDALCSLGGLAPPLLSPAETSFTRLVDGRTSVAALRERTIGFDDLLQSLIDRSLAVLVDPSSQPAGRRRVCALSPHPDDVALSIGGLLYALKPSWETTLATVTSRSRYSRWVGLQGDEARVSELRGREDALYANFLGATRVITPLPDAGAREPSAAVFHSPLSAELALFAGPIAALLTALDPETVLAPLAIGNHADHCATASVLLTHLGRLPAERRPQLLLYEDLPYASTMPGAVARRVQELADHGTELEPRHFDIDLATKISGLAIYQSQYDAERVAAMVAAYGRSLSADRGSSARERVWEAKTIGSSPVFGGPVCVPSW